MNNFKTKEIGNDLEFNKKDYILYGCIILIILLIGFGLGRFTKVEAKTDYELNNNIILSLTESSLETQKNIDKLTKLKNLKDEVIDCAINKREAIENKEKVVNDCKILINKLYK